MNNQGSILIIDDDKDIAKLLTFAFQAKGFKVHHFMTGKEGLEFLFSEKDVKVILLDRLLPDMDGLELIAHYHSQAKTKKPVIILSVLGEKEDVESGLRAGAIDYILKPFNTHELVNKISSLIDGNTSSQK